MKKIIMTILCVLMCLLPLSIAGVAAKETETESTSFVFEVDVNQRYTDIIDATEDAEFYNVYNAKDNEQQENTRRNTYIAVLIAALVVSVVILIVSLKRVPDENAIKLQSDNNKNHKE